MEEQEPITYLTQQEAAEIDHLLMGQIGFSVDQLMVCFMLKYLHQISIFSNFMSFGELHGGII